MSEAKDTTGDAPLPSHPYADGEYGEGSVEGEKAFPIEGEPVEDMVEDLNEATMEGVSDEELRQEIIDEISKQIKEEKPVEEKVPLQRVTFASSVQLVWRCPSPWQGFKQRYMEVELNDLDVSRLGDKAELFAAIIHDAISAAVVSGKVRELVLNEPDNNTGVVKL